jgi:hypothetical protein
VRPDPAEATPNDPDDILPGLRIISERAQAIVSLIPFTTVPDDFSPPDRPLFSFIARRRDHRIQELLPEWVKDIWENGHTEIDQHLADQAGSQAVRERCKRARQAQPRDAQG